MGWGDELIASGQARVMQERNGPQPVLICGRDGAARWHPAWEGNPRIARPGTANVQRLVNGPGMRPYIRAKEPDKWVWRDFACPRGELVFTPEERRYAEAAVGVGDVVVIEPRLKAKASANKDWGWAHWVELLRRFRSVRWAQLGPEGIPIVPGARHIVTPDFRSACAVLARARAVVLPEGGLHHAAAALNVPGVVIFGGYIGPAQTGYDLHANLFTGGVPCGSRLACAHCKQAMAEITPAQVWTALEAKLEVVA